MNRSIKLCAGFLSALTFFAICTTVVEASVTGTVTTAAPRNPGDITITIFVWADPQHTHGVPCSVTTTITPADIANGLTAAQKAAKIESDINASNCGVTVVRAGNVLSITAPPDGLEITGATDETGEVMLADNDGIGVPVKYNTKVKLTGSTTQTGTARFGENGVTQMVPTTAGQTIQEIYQAWAAAFGEGTVTADWFVLPQRETLTHGFDFEVTDPGLTVEVVQNLAIIVPAVSEWGLVVLTLLLMVIGTVVLARRRGGAEQVA